MMDLSKFLGTILSDIAEKEYLLFFEKLCQVYPLLIQAMKLKPGKNLKHTISLLEIFPELDEEIKLHPLSCFKMGNEVTYLKHSNAIKTMLLDKAIFVTAHIERDYVRFWESDDYGETYCDAGKVTLHDPDYKHEIIKAIYRATNFKSIYHNADKTFFVGCRGRIHRLYIKYQNWKNKWNLIQNPISL